MANDTIKVAGYVKKVIYNGNIEYRNYNPDLVGLQLTSEGGTPLFTMGNFNITTNLDPKLSKLFVTKQFSDFVTLDGLNLSVSQTETLLNNNATVFLNIDKSKLSYYAQFGSLTEFIRVGLENIIINWPASIYMQPIKSLPDGEQLIGNTYENYYYDNLTNISSFRIPTNFIKNPYNINYLTNGDISGTFNETNTLRNMVTDFASYAMLINSVEYDVVGFTGSTSTTNDYIYFEIKNNPFTATSNTISYHIKPKAIICDNFFNGLDEFEYYLLNRQIYPIYTATFKYPLRSDFGVLLYTETTLTWPTSDGYNLDYNTSAYDDYATLLLNLASDSDLINSNLMTRFLVSESITGFDTLPYYLADEDQDTSGGKINKLLNIYGVSYDNFNRYIEGLAFANTVSYNKMDNTPDVYLKNIARVMGWELIDSVVSNDLLTDYIQTSQSTYSGQSVGLTPVEADTELWRRIILNTPWIWKSKGTRSGVEFLLRFIGTPNGLVTFNEYVYRVDGPIDVDLFRTVLELNGLEPDIANYPIDNDGYPRFFDDTDDMYFQGNGLWYRETSGPNTMLDITKGNNPHVGPYDGGYKYFNQLRSLIPDFLPVTITSDTVVSSSQDLFTNYNTGEITDYNGETYVDLVYANGLQLPNCVVTSTEIISDPKPQPITTECGCEYDENDDSLSICIEKIEPPIQEEICFVGYESQYAPGIFANYPTGLFVFTQYYEDNLGNPTTSEYETVFIDRDCCTSLPVEGISMYNDVITVDTIQSGYVCCERGTKCACNVSKDWAIRQTPTYINGEPYITFATLNGLNGSTNVIVGADVSLCPPSLWSQAVPNVIDPNSGIVGFGCKLTPYGLTNIGILYNAFIDRIITGSGCDFRFPVQPTNPTPTPTCIPPVLTNVVINGLDNSIKASWTLSNVPCNNGTVRIQFSTDNVTWSDLTLTNPSVSVSNLTATSIAGYNFNSLVYFRLALLYDLSSDCNPPFTTCDGVSNTFSIDFTPIVPPPPPPPPPPPARCPFIVGTGFLTIGTTPETVTSAIAKQSTGDLIVVGKFLNYQDFGVTRTNSIVRIKQDGSKDMVFANNVGTAFANPTFNNSFAINSVVVNSDDSMYVGGNFTKFNGNDVPDGIIRLFANGTIDNSFNNGGSGTNNSSVGSVVVQPDGKILIVGAFNSYNGTTFGYLRRILRLETNGTVDTFFVTPTMSDFISQIKLLPDGRILCVGSFSNVNGDVNRRRIMRLLSDGSVDSSFTTVPFNGNVRAMGVQSDGRIIIGGDFTTVDGNTAIRIARLNPDGTYDNSFVGSISDTVSNTGTFSFGITILSDDRIMIGGQTGNGAIFRLLPSGGLDSSFQSLGFNSNSTVGPIFPYKCSASDLDEKYLVGGQFNYYQGFPNPFIVGLNNDGTRNI